MNTRTIITNETYARIIRLLGLGLSYNDVSRACGLEPDELKWIIECDSSYKALAAETLDAKATRIAATNDSWDNAEATALKALNQRLKEDMATDSVDGDFALRVAMLANKANRRKGADIEAPKELTAQVTINANFMQLIKNFTVSAVEAIEAPSKVRNQLDSSQLKLIGA